MFNVAQAVADVKNGAVLSYAATRGILCLAGVDANHFLQRLSTNDLSKLSQHSGMQTSFTDNKGRMVDHCLVFALEPNSIIVVSSHENSDALFSWLEQFQFVEEFVMTDVSAQFTMRYIIAAATTKIAQNSLMLPCWTAKIAGTPMRFYATLSRVRLENDIAIDERTFQTLRIAALMPDCPAEINDRFMPQNINLDDFISESKGCYIGQEVLAKAKTYQKHVKTLCGISLPPTAQPLIKPGSWIESNNGIIGEVTSVAPTFMPDATNALVIADLTKPSASPRNQEIFKAEENFKTIANKSS